MIMPAVVEDHLRSRAFAIIQAYLRGDLEGIAALVGDAYMKLLPMVTEILVGALPRLVAPDELERQATAWLDERAARLTGRCSCGVASRVADRLGA
jgi:hypothetical protein